ncbi:MAG: biotin--[acetyl-CoA-carboxylase] ligase [Labilithrix sp.]|nr:biotin--[acetyl-CoA-carboxylase] ligase [Labilithrix sp.]MCW5817943.1 biotin--[acetyl-CoA-carboxylase] ligase [Labilithrix sp.]
MDDLAELPLLLAARGVTLGAPLHHVAETGSTNDDAKAAAKEGAAHGALWIAEAQTHGRGRQGRTWSAAPGSSLLFSVLLRVPCAPARVPLVSLVAGLAVRDAIAHALGDDAAAMVKWPNDVLVRDKKIAGVLVESSLAGAKVESIVAGVGINVHTRDFPPELAAIATSLALEGGRTDRAALLAAVLAGLERDAPRVLQRGLGVLQARLSQHDALAGKRVIGEGVDGVARGIDADGRLLVEAGGITTRVASGEVRLMVGEG